MKKFMKEHPSATLGQLVYGDSISMRDVRKVKIASPPGKSITRREILGVSAKVMLRVQSVS